MQIIKTISAQIEAELHDAKDYVQLALKHKEGHPDLASTYYRLSEDEMNHVGKLHDAAVVLIEDYKAKKGAPPASMLAVYEYLHDRHIEAEAEVRSMMQMWKK